MKKSIQGITLFVLICLLPILLIACGTDSNSSSNDTSDNAETGQEVATQNEVEEQEQDIHIEDKAMESMKTVLEKETPTDYALIEYEPYYFTGKELPEVYALFRPESASDSDYTINIIHVYQYNIEEDAWELQYNQSIEERQQISIEGSMELTNDNREQVMLGVHEGSGSYFSYILLGSKDSENITAWLDAFSKDGDAPYYQGDFAFLDNAYFVFYESDRVAAAYQWVSSDLEQVDASSIPGLSSAETFEADSKDENVDEDILITYHVNDNQEIEANYSNQETVTATTGEYISIIREDANNSETNTRIMYEAQNDPYSIDSTTGEILAPDVITVTIIPGGYDWENAFEIYINALDNTTITPEADNANGDYEDGSADISTGDKNCSDFASQSAAQAFFEAQGPGDPHDLDRDHDGLACEAN